MRGASHKTVVVVVVVVVYPNSEALFPNIAAGMRAQHSRVISISNHCIRRGDLVPRSVV